MKKLTVFALSFLGAFILARGDSALFAAQFSTGGSGYKLATMPPPGLYYLMYNAWYEARDYIDDDGHKIRGRDPSTKVFSQTHRLVWTTDVIVLGGNLMFDVVIPLTNYDLGRTLVAPGRDRRHFGLGDPYTHVTIAWHGERYDALASTAIFWPIGDYRKNEPTSAGKGYFAIQPTLGLTLYFDEAKTWSWSTVVRYEISFRQKHTDIREGNFFHMESSFGKQLGDLALAVSTAGSWQTTDARGMGPSNEFYSEKFAIGPEVTYNIGRWGNLSLRHLFDAVVRNGPKGGMTVLTWTVPIFMRGVDL
jgi:hypothetical protein